MNVQLRFVSALLIFCVVQSDAFAQSWTQLAKPGIWRNTVDVVVVGNYMYSIELNGTLWRTDANGAYERLAGAGTFNNVSQLVALDGYLFAVENGGSFYRINTRSLRWENLGNDWGNTRVMVALNGYLYSIENDGTLYETDKDGHWKQMGEAGSFRATTLLEAMDNSLWAVAGGTLYRTKPGTLQWVQVGNKGDWANTVSWTSDRGYLWSMEANGTLFRTDSRGEFKQIGPTGSYSNTRHLFSLNNKFYAISNGTLYRSNQ